MTAIIRRLLSLGLPMAIGFISQMLISFTDAALIARIGPTELAAATLALSLFSVVMLAGLGLLSAVAPRIAETFEVGELDGLRMWFSQGTWLALIAGGIGGLLLQFTGPVLLLLGQSTAVAHLAQEYNQGAGIGLIFFFLYVNSRSTMGAVGRPKPLTVIMLLAIPINVLISWVFIFGTPWTPAGGVFGAGLSSTLVRLLVAFAGYYLLLRGKAFLDLDLRGAKMSIDWRRLGSLCALGVMSRDVVS